MINTLIFDHDGVVANTEPIWDKGLKRFLENHGIVYERNKIKPLLSGRPFNETIKVIKEAYGLDQGLEELAEERKAILKDVFGRERIEFIPGFISFYDQVKDDYKTCIATSTLDELFKISDHQLGLSELFKKRIFTLYNTGCTNKNDLFSYAVGRLESEKKDSLVIEDAPNGIEAAKKAGIRCVALTTTFDAGKLKEADLIVDSYTEVLKYLKRV